MSGVKGKPIIKADTSNKGVLIPDLDKEKSAIIVGLLSSLLEPVGRHRANHTANSKGKASRKRKRITEEAQDPVPNPSPGSSKPAVSDHLTVGFNSTTHFLEAEARRSKSKSLHDVGVGTEAAVQGSEKHMAVVFLPKSPKHEMMYAHLPVLCYTASIAPEGAKARYSTRLVLLDPSWERKIAESIGIPRVGVLGVLEDTPGAASLLDYVRDNVDPVHVPWMDKATAGDWRGVTIESLVPGQA